MYMYTYVCTYLYLCVYTYIYMYICIFIFEYIYRERKTRHSADTVSHAHLHRLGPLCSLFASRDRGTTSERWNERENEAEG